MASLVDRLFPLEQLEALGNKWPESANKRRKLDDGIGQSQSRPVVLPRRQNSEGAAFLQPRRPQQSSSSWRRHSSTYGSVATHSTTTKRSVSDSLSQHTPAWTSSVNSDGLAATTKSWFPTFIEPALLKVYLQNLHPKDRPRYSLPSSFRREMPPPEPKRTMASHHDTEDSASTPGSLTTDASSPHSLGDRCATPPTGIFEQLRPGLFSHLIDGLRLTEHERGFMHDMLNPAPQMSLMPMLEPTTTKRKATQFEADVELPEDYAHVDHSLLQKIFPQPDAAEMDPLSGYEYYAETTDADRDNDVHSSCMSPATEEEEDYETPAGIIMPTHAPLSVDDFFDLDEAAAEAPSPLTI
ncbi:hypothetical protein H2202_009701 [Exophiala xenobiotica]|nr:hypothetical protein H2202_009701 [Exophiala xenobiotica]KAK5203709.1 hypothetical protein LTR41_010589 [Exophiala xenobiotica]KAK5218019.1 hypothetical protein LTR72_009190 [Exophiala xenobiotica]KAK5227842.1 hypothetical protein LTR47_008413 [Exophiala xenobiotica]KAK5253435.1 hypothetical protein LTS06_002146 [Exophiala xenobiotica]